MDGLALIVCAWVGVDTWGELTSEAGEEMRDVRVDGRVNIVRAAGARC